MTESIKEVITRMKAKQQSSPASIQAKAVKPVPVPQETEGGEELDEEIDELDEELPEKQEKVSVKPSNEVIEASKEGIAQQIMMEIEMLQNNGRYRAELLHQLQEINRALVVIAGVLVDLTGNGKTEK